MVIAVKTRELKRDLDYDWEDYFPSDKSLSVEAGKLHRALEGADVDSRFAVLLRSSNSVGVTLGVSVSTNRNDAVGRPIRTMAFLRAEKPEEADLLARFFVECLRKSDTETLYDAASGVAKAVESLYQTKKLDDFMQFCRSLPTVNGGGVKLADRCSIPRDDTTARSVLAESIPELIGDNKPFLLALTDRLPTDVLDSLGSMFDHAIVRIFSKATEKPEKLPEPASQKYRRAAAIGGAALLVLLVAAIGIFDGETKSRTSGGTTAQQIPPIFDVDTDHSKWIWSSYYWFWSSCYACHQQYTTTRAVNIKRSVRPTDFWWTCSSSHTNALTQDVTDTNIHPTSQEVSDEPATSAATNASPQEAKGTSHP